MLWLLTEKSISRAGPEKYFCSEYIADRADREAENVFLRSGPTLVFRDIYWSFQRTAGVTPLKAQLTKRRRMEPFLLLASTSSRGLAWQYQDSVPGQVNQVSRWFRQKSSDLIKLNRADLSGRVQTFCRKTVVKNEFLYINLKSCSILWWLKQLISF